MITIKVDPKSRIVLAKLRRHKRVHEQHIRAQLFVTGNEVVREVRRLIGTGSRSGRIYTYRGRPHQASAPGEPPAKRSGRLLGSSSYVVRGSRQMEVGESVEYALYLEEGTVKMAPRPHLIRAVLSENLNLRIALEEMEKGNI